VSRPSTPLPWSVLVVTSLAVFMAFLDLTIVNVAFPGIARSFAAIPLADLSWVLTAYNVVFAALLVPAGRLADHVGRRRVFLAGLTIFTAASALCGVAPSATTLIGARALQAIGAAVVIPASLGLLLATFPIARRATVVSLYGAAAGVASAVGPSLGGLLVDVSSWRLVFLVNVPLGLGAYLAGRAILRESREPVGAHPDAVGAAALVVSVASLALAITKGEDWGWSSASVLGAFAAAAVTAGLFVCRSRRHRAPLVELSLFRIRSFAAGNASTALFATGFYAAILCNVLFLTSVWRYSVLEAGLSISPAPLAAALVAGPAGRLADRFGQRIVALPGLLLFIVGVAWLAQQVNADPDFTAVWLPGALVYGISIGLAFPALASAAVAVIPPARFATASAVNATVRQLGAVLGVSVLVAILDATASADPVASFRYGWGLAAAAAAASVIPALFLPGAAQTVEGRSGGSAEMEPPEDPLPEFARRGARQ
jgi:EmrB/QacA subfamily drug resistance transporter